MSDCRAVVNIAGAHYQCELDAPHPGLAHANMASQAIWCSHYEAIRNTPKTPQEAGTQ